MRNIGSIALLGTGIVLLVVAAAFFSGSTGPGRVVVVGVLGIIGLGLTFMGLFGMMRAGQIEKQNQLILKTGIDGEGKVTFVDKNYSLLINNKPIYSIVEYRYKDGSGKEWMRRVPNVPSDLVIRSRIEVGSTVKIKYLREDPGRSVFMMGTPNA